MKNNKNIGKHCWVVPDGFLPRIAENRDSTAYVSHECLCILNAGTEPASIEITIYFEDRNPRVIGDIKVAAQRSRHLRMNELQFEGQPVIEQGCPYSVLVESDNPIIIQMSRLDTTQEKMAFLSTMGFPVE
ncbi:MAG: sensory rhodopsin transducer [Sedimentisphaerales bacterium]|nr:sensory rhodopsin transducer [Sedimentisphaerales bacterium]